MASEQREPPNWQTIIERALFGRGFQVGADQVDTAADRFAFALKIAGLIGALILAVRLLIRFMDAQ